MSASLRKLPPGHLVAGKYRLVEHLGGGGMGEVFRAEHAFAGRTVAIKLLRPELAANEDLSRRLFFEAQAVNRIRHPNIVDVLDAGIADEGPYLVMEYLRGTSLATALDREGRLDLTTAIAVAIPVLTALEAAHVEGIVHRDLKPGNIFLALGKTGPTVKVLDFGVAKAVGAGAGHTSTGMVLGTPDYLSPEQATGEPLVDGRSDVFSAGTVLFETLTGKRPFEAPAAIATAYRIVHADTPTLAALGIFGAELLDPVLARALAKQPDDRFRSAAEMASALAGIAPSDEARALALGVMIKRLLGETTGPQPIAFAPTVAASVSATRDGGVPSSDAKTTPKPAGSNAPTMVSNNYASSSPNVRATPLNLPVRDRFGDPRPSTPAPNPVTPSYASRRPVTPSGSDSLPPIGRSRGEPPTPISSRPDATFSVRPATDAPGQSHSRGTLPRALYRMVGRSHGNDARERALQLLPDALAETYRNDGFNTLFWYEIGSADEFLHAVTETILRREPAGWRRLARDNFEQELAPIFRPMRFSDVETTLRRVSAAHARVFDFGAVVVQERRPGLATIQIEGFGAASMALRSFLWGAFEGMFAFLSGRPELRATNGYAAFAKEFEIEVTWQPT